MRFIAPLLVILMISAAAALADPNGPALAVTDMGPFCASCHASTSASQMKDLSAELAAAETIEEKHLSRIKTDPSYKDLSPADRETLIAAIKWMDQQAEVKIKIARQAKRNSRIEVTVITKGGAGPVVGVSLVDSALRFQARPIGSSGFKVIGPALVVGPDGKAQSQWTERRYRGSDMGLSTVMIAGIKGDAVSKRIDESRTTWILRAPPDPGNYTIVAVFFYGTEKAHPLGITTRQGRPEPRGGMSGAGGRVMFSDVVTITVT